MLFAYGAPTMIRTPGLFSTKELLYQLSYRGKTGLPSAYLFNSSNDFGSRQLRGFLYLRTHNYFGGDYRDRTDEPSECKSDALPTELSPQ